MMYHPSREEAAALDKEASARGFLPWRPAAAETIGYRSPAAPGDPRPPLAFLVIHGNGGHAVHRADYAGILRAAAPENAVSVYLLEYPGYGARPGSPSEESILAAARQALDRIPAGAPVVVLGESLGSGVACGLAASRPERVAGLLLLAPFESLAGVAGHHYPLLPVRWVMRDTYPAGEWLKSYRGPVVFVVAAEDRTIPPWLGRRLHDSYSGAKQLVISDGAGHDDLPSALGQAEWRRILRFLGPR